MTFDHLTPGQFEEFVYDLLKVLGFVDLDWRKGTGRPGFSSDQGRDIVGELVRLDVDKRHVNEGWFFQCKHYKRGVPAEQLHAGLAWAMAERPVVIVFVASNFLSNSAKNYLEDYNRNNHPPFRVKIWERKDLEDLVAGHHELKKRYDLSGVTWSGSTQEEHFQYAMAPQLNTLDFLFSILDSVELKQRDEIFGWAYHHVIKPRFRSPRDEDETLGELLIDRVNYQAFKSKCYSLSEEISESFLVQAVVISVLAFARKMADPDDMKKVEARYRDALIFFKGRLEIVEEQRQRNLLTKMIERTEGWLRNLPDKQHDWQNLYQYLCREVVARMLSEERVFK